MHVTQMLFIISLHHVKISMREVFNKTSLHITQTLDLGKTGVLKSLKVNTVPGNSEFYATVHSFIHSQDVNTAPSRLGLLLEVVVVYED